MNNHECQKLYRLATLEIDEKKIPERIVDARGSRCPRDKKFGLGRLRRARICCPSRFLLPLWPHQLVQKPIDERKFAFVPASPSPRRPQVKEPYNHQR